MKLKTWGKFFLPIIGIFVCGSIAFIPSINVKNQENKQFVQVEKTISKQENYLSQISTCQDIELGQDFSGAVVTDVDNDDHLYLWGKNNRHRVSASQKTIEANPVEKVLPERKIKKLALGLGDNAGAITVDQEGANHLYMWGYDKYGQTGKGSSGLIRNYQEIKINEKKIQDLVIGNNHSAIVTSDEENNDHLYLMGSNAFGQLGNLEKPNSYLPLKLELPETKIKDISLGYDFSSVVTTDQDNNDHLYLWGRNNYGQLGNGTTNNQSELFKVILPETKIKEIKTNYNRTSVVTTDQGGADHLYMWGGNSYGQLGNGNTISLHQPTEIFLPETTIKKTSLGYNHSGVITTNQKGEDQLYFWGDNYYGQLGNGNTINQLEPIKITLAEKTIQDISLGNNHSSIIVTSKKGQSLPYLWGNNRYGQLGNGNTTNQYLPGKVILAEKTIQEIKMSDNRSAVVTTNFEGDNHLYMWGANFHGQLGNGNTINQHQPVEISLPETKIKKISLGQNHSSAITIDEKGENHLYFWGDNYYGQLGNGNTINQHQPVEITLPEKIIKDVNLGYDFSSVITTDEAGFNHLYLWGDNTDGKLGIGNTVNQYHPIKVNLPEITIQEVALSRYHTSALTIDRDGKNHLYMWGNNSYGQLGNGNTISQKYPMEIPLPEAKAKKINLGYEHSSIVAINENGEEHLYLWGNNSNGQLGNSDTDVQYHPAKITLPEMQIKDVSLGEKHSSLISIDQNGENHLYLWGDNRYGQLGNGETISQHQLFERTFSESKIDSVSLGNNHSSVITVDEKGKTHLYFWGDNSYGQLGLSFMQPTNIPISIANEKQAVIFDYVKLNQLLINDSQAQLLFTIHFADFNLITTNQINKQNVKVHIDDSLQATWKWLEVKNNTLVGHLEINGLIPGINYDNLTFEIAHSHSKDIYQVVIPTLAILN